MLGYPGNPEMVSVAFRIPRKYIIACDTIVHAISFHKDRLRMRTRIKTKAVVAPPTVNWSRRAKLPLLTVKLDVCPVWNRPSK